MSKATIEEWANLYENALKLKEIKPWASFSFLDTITLKLPDREEMYFVSIDEAPDYITINILRDPVSYGQYIGTALDAEYTELEVFNIISSLDVFSMCISNRDSVFKNQLNIIKELALPFKGRMSWIFFLSKRKGYLPADPDRQEVLFLTECIEQIYQAIMFYHAQKMDINFDEGYSLCRYYNDDEKKWLTFEKKVELKKAEIEFYEFKNEIQLQRIKKMPATGLQLELDVTYVKSKMNENSQGREPMARLLLIGSKSAGEISTCKLLLPVDDLSGDVFNALFDVMGRFGKASKIFIKSDLCEGILSDLCEKADINLTKVKQLPIINGFLKVLMNEN